MSQIIQLRAPSARIVHSSIAYESLICDLRICWQTANLPPRLASSMRRATKLSGLLRPLGGAPTEGCAVSGGLTSARRGTAASPALGAPADGAAAAAAQQRGGIGWFSVEDLNPKLREAEVRA